MAPPRLAHGRGERTFMSKVQMETVGIRLGRKVLGVAGEHETCWWRTHVFSQCCSVGKQDGGLHHWNERWGVQENLG